MARLHPSFPLSAVYTQGEQAERSVLKQLELDLPNHYDIFHNLPWSNLQSQNSVGQQTFGEIDIVILSPLNQLLAIEIKSGQLEVVNNNLIKLYKTQSKNALDQAHRNRNQLVKKLANINNQITVNSLLVLPDFQIQAATLAYPREFIVDSTQMPNLAHIIQQSFNAAQDPSTFNSDTKAEIINFLSERFEVIPDVSSQIGRVQHNTTQLASGLATWVPKISHSQNIYNIEATAGSGKTQLALALLKQATKLKQRACYVCFNRSLADHMRKLAPPLADVSTFHQICHAYAEKLGQSIDFSQTSTFKFIETQFIKAHENNATQIYDLLILDESQDFEPEWVSTIASLCKDTGKLYLMGDQDQKIFPRENFSLEDAIQIVCMDNFRSSQRVVQTINQLKLTTQPVSARSMHLGETPNFYTFDKSQGSHFSALNKCLLDNWKIGFDPSEVVILSFSGSNKSETLNQIKLGGYKTRRSNGFDENSNAIWTDGELVVDSIYRYKGQSSPKVILCEIDFEEFTEKEKRKLFVGMTRGQLGVDLVISETAISKLISEL